MITAMQVVVLASAVFSIAGCGQGDSSAGVVERGDGATVSAPQTPSVAPGKAQAKPQATVVVSGKRWPTSSIGLNVSTPWAVQAGRVWNKAGVTFRHGATDGITFGGFSTARPALGWAQFKYRRGIIYQCNIYINPRYLHRYDIAETFAHELGHCLGIDGHLPTGGLMSTYGGNGRVAASTINLIRGKYVGTTRVASTVKLHGNRKSTTGGQDER